MYISMGIISLINWQLYLICTGCNAVGVLLGDRASTRVNQVGFGRILTGLQVVCMSLLFMAAFGLGKG